MVIFVHILIGISFIFSIIALIIVISTLMVINKNEKELDKIIEITKRGI